MQKVIVYFKYMTRNKDPHQISNDCFVNLSRPSKNKMDDQ